MMKKMILHPKGFTLIEILVAFVISSIVLTAGYLFYTNQVKGYLGQREIIDMQQNLRRTMEYMERHVRLAGNAIPYNVFWKPLHTGAGEGAEPDTIGIMGSVKSIAIETTQNTTPNGVAVKVSDTSAFSVGDIVVISDGTFSEVFQITDIPNSIQLKHATSPPYNDDVHLNNRYTAPSTVTMISHIFFYIDSSIDPDHPALVRSSPNLPRIQTLGENIEDMQLTYIMQDGSEVESTDDVYNIRLIKFTLRARTENEEDGYTDPVYGDGFRRASLTRKIIPRSINM